MFALLSRMNIIDKWNIKHENTERNSSNLKFASHYIS